MTGTICYHWLPSMYCKPRDRAIHAIVLHSTDGHKTGDLQALQYGDGRSISAHWYVTKSGDYYHFVDDSQAANHTGIACSPQYGNAATVGVEQEHVDGKEEWPACQIQATANLCAFLLQDLGELEITSHAVVAAPPGRKVDPVGYPWADFHALVAEARRTIWTPNKLS